MERAAVPPVVNVFQRQRYIVLEGVISPQDLGQRLTAGLGAGYEIVPVGAQLMVRQSSFKGCRLKLVIKADRTLCSAPLPYIPSGRLRWGVRIIEVIVQLLCLLPVIELNNAMIALIYGGIALIVVPNFAARLHAAATAKLRSAVSMAMSRGVADGTLKLAIKPT